MSSTTVSRDLPVPSNIAKKYFGESSNADETCTSWSDGEVGRVARFVLASQIVQRNLDRTMVRSPEKNEVESYSSVIDTSKNKASSSLPCNESKKVKIKLRRERVPETFEHNIATTSSARFSFSEFCDDQPATLPVSKEGEENTQFGKRAQAVTQAEFASKRCRKSFSGAFRSNLKGRKKRVTWALNHNIYIEIEPKLDKGFEDSGEYLLNRIHRTASTKKDRGPNVFLRHESKEPRYSRVRVHETKFRTFKRLRSWILGCFKVESNLSQ